MRSTIIIAALLAAAAPTHAEPVMRVPLPSSLIVMNGPELPEAVRAAATVQMPANVKVGDFFETDIVVDNGEGPFEIGFGDETPMGFVISAGRISGTFEMPGPFTFDAVVVDKGDQGRTAAIRFSTVVERAPDIVSTGYSFASFSQGEAVTMAAPTSSGGHGLHTFSIQSGALPSGLRLQSDGKITGTVLSAVGAAGTVEILISDGFGSNAFRQALPWSIAAQSAEGAKPVSATARHYGGQWYTYDGYNVVSTSDGKNDLFQGMNGNGFTLQLDMGTTVRATNVTLGGLDPFSYTVRTGATPQSATVWVSGNHPGTGMLKIEGVPREHRYFILETTAPSEWAYLTEFRMGAD